jgi:hypothetical protein
MIRKLPHQASGRIIRVLGEGPNLEPFRKGGGSSLLVHETVSASACRQAGDACQNQAVYFVACTTALESALRPKRDVRQVPSPGGNNA